MASSNLRAIGRTLLRYYINHEARMVFTQILTRVCTGVSEHVRFLFCLCDVLEKWEMQHTYVCTRGTASRGSSSFRAREQCLSHPHRMFCFASRFRILTERRRRGSNQGSSLAPQLACGRGLLPCWLTVRLADWSAFLENCAG